MLATPQRPAILSTAPFAAARISVCHESAATSAVSAVSEIHCASALRMPAARMAKVSWAERNEW